MARNSTATIADTAAEFEIPRLSPEAIAFARDTRHVSAKTLAQLSACSGTEYFAKIKRDSTCIKFPYYRDGQVVNWKAAAWPEKAFTGMTGGKMCLLNIDLLMEAEPGDIYIVEGEWDAAAMIEAGFPVERVTTVPNGAQDDQQKPKEGEAAEESPAEKAGLGYLRDARDMGLVQRHHRIIICGDADRAGEALRHHIVAVLGEAKTWFVDWPEGIKDANEMLIKEGKEDLRDYVQNSLKPWPVEGVYTLSQLPETAPIKPWVIPHFPSWHNKILLAPGTMSVVTGHPGHGKTALFAQIWHDIAQCYGIVIATATFETRAKPHYRRILRTLQSGMLERDMSLDQIRKADAWIEAHYLFIQHSRQAPTLEWFLEKAATSIIRHKAKVIQIDPWNRVESLKAPYETETEYIGKCLTALYTFASQYNVHVQVLAHPSKMDGPRKLTAPELDDIAGSKHWDNRVDQGFVVHRKNIINEAKRCTEAEIYHKKTRFQELGHTCKFKINYRVDTGRFEEVTTS